MDKFKKSRSITDGAGSEVEPTEWITVDNGQHVPIKEGQTKKEAVQEHFQKASGITSAENSEKENAPGKDLERILGKEYKGYKGQAAIEKLLNEKQGHIKAAFHREDIGDIDLLWGNEKLGLQHILSRREEQGINTKEFISELTNAIHNGNFRKKNERGNFEFFYNGKIIIISPELYGNKITYVLTAFKTHSKK